jgi:hypothetical protein
MEASRRTELFAEVNDRIYELLAYAEPDLSGEFLCECGEECGRRVELLPEAFASLRKSGLAIRANDCRPPSFLRRRRPNPGVGIAVLS